MKAFYTSERDYFRSEVNSHKRAVGGHFILKRYWKSKLRIGTKKNILQIRETEMKVALKRTPDKRMKDEINKKDSSRENWI